MEEPRIKSPTFILFPLFRSRKNNKLGHGSSVPDLHLLIRKRKQEKKNALTNDYLYHYKVKQNKIYISLCLKEAKILWVLTLTLQQIGSSPIRPILTRRLSLHGSLIFTVC